MPDSYIRFRVPADGDYLLEVEDRLRRGAPDYVYVIDAAPPEPIAEVTLDERRRYEATVIEVPRGGRAAVLLTVARRDFGGDLQAEFPNLPPGVQADCRPLAANFNRIPVIFSASEEALSGSSLTPVSMKPVEEGKQLATRFQQQTWLIRGRNNFPVWSHYADLAAVAVTEPLPFELSIDQPKAPIVRGGQQELRIHAHRKEGFEKPVAVRLLYHPPGLASNNSRSIPAKQDSADIPVTANGNAALGKWTVTVIGELNDSGRVFTCTPFFTMEVVEPYFDMSLPTIAARQGDSVEMPIELHQRTPFEGAARLELIRLPPGVTSAPIEITKDDTTATFHLTIDAQAQPGRHRGVSCQARLMVNGEPVLYTQAYVDVQVDRLPQPAKTALKPGESRDPS
ncbi:MAG: hypothetical protein KDA37_10265, partial [Planctomycetales bacterium]|nr:hypothetical protein [Planctomycetales bacterium]